MKRTRVALVVLLVLSIAAPLAAQSARDSARRLRTLFLQRDYETAVLEGRKLVATFPDASELAAWHVLNLARGGQEDQAVTLAQELTKKKPGDGWAWLALGGALNYQRERPADAIAAAEKALGFLPGHPDAVWLRAQTLANDEKRRDEAIAFVDKHRSSLKNPAEILATKGYVFYVKSSSAGTGEEMMKVSLATFEEARRIDPSNLSAWYLPGSYLNGLRRSDEAYPLLKKAVELAPGSTAVHQAYWNAVNGSREFGPERKLKEIDADVAAFLEANGNRPGALSAVASISRTMKWADRQRTVEERILKDFSDSPEAEWVLVYRWRELGRTKEGAASPEYRRILTDYVARPQHHHKGLLGEAYRDLFGVLQADPAVSEVELYRVAEGALKYETNNPHIVWVYTPLALAERKIRLTDAERIARDGIDVLRKKVESQRSFYKTQGEFERSLDSMTALGHDALGWVLFMAGRIEEAEKALLKSYDLNHASRTNLDHLGRFYESKNDLPRAEEYYVKGLGVQALGENPCEKSLRALYARRHGSMEGFDAYLAALRDAEREARRERVLAERLREPQAVPGFDLKGLDGKKVSLESLKGKVVVINYWGVWCGWCVYELPEYQKLFEKYANDPGVAILTIDNDANPDDVPLWMAQKKYTFPVLIDDGYVRRNGIQSFPTTWFLDPQGHKLFEKVGWSEKLLEEFSWRIEAIRGTK